MCKNFKINLKYLFPNLIRTLIVVHPILKYAEQICEKLLRNIS